MGERTKQDLQQLQALPLSLKVRLTKDRIRQWVNEFGVGGVYVSFSGGKDSTVLLHIVRELYPDIPAVFCDTGLEYPEIRQFVKGFQNVVWLKPKMNFKQVVEKYGYPFISKEISNTIYFARNGSDGKFKSTRLQRLRGEYLDKSGNKSAYNCEKWAFMLDAPFEVNDKCCAVMKKKPTKQYERETGKVPMLAMMAEESRLREQKWIKTGCNAFLSKRPQSNPMAFWTEQDVLKYIKKNDIEICSVYGDIVEDNEIPGQMTWGDYIDFDVGEKLKTTGCKRTGCMFCGYGCHLEKHGEGRFERMKKTHPKQYDYIMRPWEQGGLNYKEVIDWMNEHGNLSIIY